MVTGKGEECVPRALDGIRNGWIREQSSKCLTTSIFGSQTIRVDPGQESILGAPRCVRH